MRIARDLKLHVIPFAKGEGRFAKGDWVHEGMFTRGDLQGHRRFHLYVSLFSVVYRWCIIPLSVTFLH